MHRKIGKTLGGISQKGFPGGSDGNVSACSVEDLGSIPRLVRSPRERKSYPFQYSGLENSMNHIVCAVTKSWTRLSNFTFFFSPS